MSDNDRCSQCSNWVTDDVICDECKDYEHFEKMYSDELSKLSVRLEAAEDRLEKSTDWYQQRFSRLRTWVEDEVRPLSSDVARRYYAICANGSPAPHESADWTDTMHALRLRAEQAERKVAENAARLAAAEAVIAALPKCDWNLDRHNQPRNPCNRVAISIQYDDDTFDEDGFRVHRMNGYACDEHYPEEPLPYADELRAYLALVESLR